jgi:tetratricopeptide (TPR) repeat protein
LNNNDLSEARTLIQQATAHPETANDPQTWRVKGDIGNRAFDNELTREMLDQPVNHRAMFDGLFNSFTAYVRADSLAEIPDARGRVRNRVRRDIVDIVRANHMHLINGGVFFNDEGNPARAADFFEAFWNTPSLPMFEGAREPFLIDSTFQSIKFFAFLTAQQAGERQRAIAFLHRIKNEPFIENSWFSESDTYELLATAYLELGDSVSYMRVLETGARRFPTNTFLVRSLINQFIMSGDSQRALSYLETAIANDPAGGADLISVRGAIFADMGDTEGAIREYRRALSIDPRSERALEALARHYIVQAQDLREATFLLPRAQQIEGDKQILELFQLALPLLEQLQVEIRSRYDSTERELTNVLMLLRNVYYNLIWLGVDKSAQLEVVERQIPD